MTGSAHTLEAGRRTPRRFLVVSSLVIFVAFLAQQPGRLIADTKLDLVINPVGFLARALHAWEAHGYLGQLQNQAVGYFLPVGPFFALGHVSGMPMWIVQRLWMSVVLIVALWGAVRVADALGIGSPTTRFLGGATYALSPFFIMVVGSTSSNLLPAALLPWALLALIRGSREGSTVGAAAKCGLLVAAMSGINGMTVVAVLPMLALWILTRQRSPRRRSLFTWWTVSMVLACLWWVLPLLLQAHYGFNFLRFTEQSSTTTAYASAVEALRGTSHWLSYYNLGDPWLPAGWTLVSSWAPILATCAVAAMGLFGVAHRPMPERKFLVLSLGIGLVAVACGYGGSLGGVLSSPVQVLLTKIAALRNVHKFEPLIRLPLALGLAHAMALLAPRVRVRRVATAGLVFALVLGASPFLLERVAPRGTFTALPRYWQQAASFLKAGGNDGWTLVLPASTFGDYVWGRPLDEPLQPLDATPWVARNLVPSAPGSGALLDAVEARLASGVRSPGLGELLGRSGIRYVLVRNDLDYSRSDSLSPVMVHEALAGAGLHQVASFGPSRPVPLETARFVPELGLSRLESTYQAIEIFQVNNPGSMVATYSQSDQMFVTGGPGSILSLADRGLLNGRAAVLASDAVSLPDGKNAWAVTDGAQLRDVDFGLIHNNASYVLTPTEDAPGRHAPQQFDARGGPDHQTVKKLKGVRSITASSYGSWLVQVPELAPANAFDSDPSTAWVAANSKGSEGQWVQVNLNKPLSIPSISVRLLEEGRWRPAVTKLRVSTDRGSVTTPVVPTEADQKLTVPQGAAKWIRITFESVEGELNGLAGAGFREVAIPGVTIDQALHVPAEASAAYSGADATTPFYVFNRSTANPHDLLRQDEEKALKRDFDTPRAAPFPVSGTVVPVRGEPLDALLAASSPLEVTASSSWNADPQFRVSNLIDGSDATSWIAQPPGLSAASFSAQPGARALGRDPLNIQQGTSAPALVDSDPTIRLHWGDTRTIDSLRIVPDATFAAPPQRIRLTSPDGQRDLTVPPDGAMTFPPLRTNRVDVSFPQTAVRETVDALTRKRTLVPVGLAELDFPALRDLRPTDAGPPRTVALPCGRGPNVVIDGVTLPTAVEASVQAVTDLQPVPFTVCPPGNFSLAAGAHHLEVQPTATFAAGSLTLGQPSPLPAPVAGPSVTIDRWDTNSRDLTVGPGDASYLAVRQNFNDGWHAQLAGKTLRPVLLDGWQQGFVVPAGAGGQVHLHFQPDTWYRAGLLVGLLALVALVMMAFVPWRRRTAVYAAAAADARIGAGIVLLSVLATLLVGGPLVVVVVALLFVARRRPEWLGWIAAGAFLLAGVAVALHPGRQPGTSSGAFGFPAQALSVFAAASVFAALAVDGLHRIPIIRASSGATMPTEEPVEVVPDREQILVPHREIVSVSVTSATGEAHRDGPSPSPTPANDEFPATASPQPAGVALDRQSAEVRLAVVPLGHPTAAERPPLSKPMDDHFASVLRAAAEAARQIIDEAQREAIHVRTQAEVLRRQNVEAERLLAAARAEATETVTKALEELRSAQAARAEADETMSEAREELRAAQTARGEAAATMGHAREELRSAKAAHASAVEDADQIRQGAERDAARQRAELGTEADQFVNATNQRAVEIRRLAEADAAQQLAEASRRAADLLAAAGADADSRRAVATEEAQALVAQATTDGERLRQRDLDDSFQWRAEMQVELAQCRAETEAGAQQILSEAEQEAAEVLARVAEQGAHLIASATAVAARLRSDAEVEVERMRADAAEDSAEVPAQVQRTADARRARMITELGDLRAGVERENRALRQLAREHAARIGSQARAECTALVDEAGELAERVRQAACKDADDIRADALLEAEFIRTEAQDSVASRRGDLRQK